MCCKKWEIKKQIERREKSETFVYLISSSSSTCTFCIIAHSMSNRVDIQFNKKKTIKSAAREYIAQIASTSI